MTQTWDNRRNRLSDYSRAAFKRSSYYVQLIWPGYRNRFIRKKKLYSRPCRSVAGIPFHLFSFGDNLSSLALLCYFADAGMKTRPCLLSPLILFVFWYFFVNCFILLLPSFQLFVYETVLSRQCDAFSAVVIFLFCLWQNPSSTNHRTSSQHKSLSILNKCIYI